MIDTVKHLAFTFEQARENERLIQKGFKFYEQYRVALKELSFKDSLIVELEQKGVDLKNLLDLANKRYSNEKTAHGNTKKINDTLERKLKFRTITLYGVSGLFVAKLLQSSLK